MTLNKESACELRMPILSFHTNAVDGEGSAGFGVYFNHGALHRTRGLGGGKADGQFVLHHGDGQ